MKVTDREPDFWHVRSDEEPLTLANFLAAAAVFAIWLIVIYLWMVLLWAAQ